MRPLHHQWMVVFSRAWRKLRTGFWFFPTLLTISALVLAPILVQLDERLQAAGRLPEWLTWIYGGQIPGARRLLSAIAAAMMAISTVMFSCQTTALTFIGQEYGSRLLRNFLADSRNQIVFGTYVSTFVYALMVLRTIHKDPDDAPVPYLAVSFGIILAVVGLGVLIYSMYHISQFLQSSTIINYAAGDLEMTIRRLTDSSGAATSPEADWPVSDRPGSPVTARIDGYIQYVREHRLLALCRRHNCRVRIHHRIGDFVVAGAELATLSGPPSSDPALVNSMADMIVLGPQPNIEQDLRYAVNQLVQIALRAASTDRNDLLTIGMCMDRMAGALCLLARCRPAPVVRCDETGIPRLAIESAGFADAIDTFVRPLREIREASPSLFARLLAMVRTVAPWAARGEDRDALRQTTELIFQAAEARIDSAGERELVVCAYQKTCRSLEPSFGTRDASRA